MANRRHQVGIARAGFLLPSLGSAIFLGIFFVLLVKSGSTLLADGDTGYHIRAGDFMIQNGSVPTRDIFSYLIPPPPWMAHEWLSEVLMAAIYRLSGLSGVVIFFSFFLALTHAMLYRWLRSACSDVALVTAITALAVATSSTHWLARPHVFSIALTLVWYQILEDYQSDKRDKLLALPPLMILWVNLHGGFAFGLLLPALYACGNFLSWIAAPPSTAGAHLHKAKRLFLFAVACVLVALINPRGYEILLFPFRLVSDRFLMDQVAEFLSPDFHQPLPFKYMLLILIAAAAASKRRLNPIEIALIVLLTYMTLYSVRYVSLFAVIASRPLLKMAEGLIQDLPPRYLQFYQRRSRNLALLDASTSRVFWPALSLAAVAALALGGWLHFEFDPKRFPVAAVEFFKREAPTGNIFNHDEFGDYLIFSAWPQYRVFIDGRSDMYGERHVKNYRTIANGQPEWQRTLEQYDISLVFFSPRSPIAALLKEQKNWTLVYSDDVASIFARNDERNRAVIEKYRSRISSP